MTGLKSFGSRTVVECRSGVRAVGGPNGGGKTNIVDAIRWVLGEQRTSTLRAERMEAVIFNGTAKRRPLGMAEVTLTIENSSGILPTSFSEVAITRRLYRSGESEYLINRTPSRLRDIHELFSDTGLGHSTYSIIELAMVEGILNGPSETRRALFEEAAGIAAYKARRYSAQRRLQSTVESLSRLEDVFGEIEKRYRTLKRQASKAQRYQGIVRALELRLFCDFADERLTITGKQKPLEKRLSKLVAERERLEAEGGDLRTQLTSLEGSELALIDRLNHRQDDQKRLDRREAESSGELALASQRLAFLKDSRSAVQSNRTELETELAQAAAGLESVRKEEKELARRADDIRSELERLSGEFDGARAEYEKAAAALKKTRKDSESIRRHIDLTESRIQQRRRELQSLHRKHESLKAELNAVQAKGMHLAQGLSEAGSAVESATAELGRTRAELEQSSRALETARHSYNKALAAHARSVAEAESERAAVRT